MSFYLSQNIWYCRNPRVEPRIQLGGCDTWGRIFCVDIKLTMFSSCAFLSRLCHDNGWILSWIIWIIESVFFQHSPRWMLTVLLCGSEPVELMVDHLLHPRSSTCSQPANQNSHLALTGRRVPGHSGAAGPQICSGGAVPEPSLATPSRSRPASAPWDTQPPPPSSPARAA